MVRLLTGCREFTTLDASDGLALAICHAQTLATRSRRPAAYLPRSKKRLSLAEAVGVSPEMVTAKRLKT
jgi:hypothetical protein